MEAAVSLAITQGRVLSETDQRIHFAKKEMVDDLATLEYEDIERFYADEAPGQ